MANLVVALKQLRKQRDRIRQTLAGIDAAIAALGAAGARKSSRRRGRRKLSTAARRRIAAAQKARWAKWRMQKS